MCRRGISPHAPVRSTGGARRSTSIPDERGQGSGSADLIRSRSSRPKSAISMGAPSPSVRPIPAHPTYPRSDDAPVSRLRRSRLPPRFIFRGLTAKSLVQYRGQETTTARPLAPDARDPVRQRLARPGLRPDEDSGSSTTRPLQRGGPPRSS